MGHSEIEKKWILSFYNRLHFHCSNTCKTDDTLTQLQNTSLYTKPTQNTQDTIVKPKDESLKLGSTKVTSRTTRTPTTEILFYVFDIDGLPTT